MTIAHPSSTLASPSRRSKLAAATEPPIRPGPATSVVAMGGANIKGVITLANTQLRLDIVPALGGGMTRFDWRSDGALVPIFRPCAVINEHTDPNELACYPLLPYSNRIGGGNFNFLGRCIDIPCNRPGEPLPLHGDGWLGAWDVESESSTQVRLSLDRVHGAPYSFRASQLFTLDDCTLTISLSIENTGRDAMPFGLGLHPFLTREADTELSAAADGLWLCGNDLLPVRHVPAPAAWQFGVAYPMPRDMVNNAFTGWSGRSSVMWPRRRLSLTISANTDYYILYAPKGKDFFCFEPVDHPINAMNLPGGGEAHGMTVLSPGETLSREFRFTVERSGNTKRRGRPRHAAGQKALKDGKALKAHAGAR